MTFLTFIEISLNLHDALCEPEELVFFYLHGKHIWNKWPDIPWRYSCIIVDIIKIAINCENNYVICIKLHGANGSNGCFAINTLIWV